MQRVLDGGCVKKRRRCRHEKAGPPVSKTKIWLGESYRYLQLLLNYQIRILSGAAQATVTKTSNRVRLLF